MGPDDIRRLRGDLSRADFARRLGVTPLTVYRWELPLGASEARRPSEKMLRLLAEVSGGTVRAAGTNVLAAPLAAEQESIPPEEHVTVTRLVEGFFAARLREVEDEAMSLLVSERLSSRGGKAMTSAILSMSQLVARHEVRGAWSALREALGEAERGALPAEADLLVRLAAALVFSFPDPHLFDVGRVNLHAEHAQQCFSVETLPDIRFLLGATRVVAMLHAGGPDAISFLRSHRQSLDPVGCGTLCVVTAHELLAHLAIADGAPSEAARRFRDVARRAADAGLPVFEARALAFLALHLLEEAVEPGEVLAVTAQAREVTRRAHLNLGLHAVQAAAAEARALTRLGRAREAEVAFQESRAASEQLGWNPTVPTSAIARVYLYRRDVSALRTLATWCGASGSRSHVLTAKAGEAFASALAELSAGGTAEQVLPLFRDTMRLAEEGGTLPYLTREFESESATTHVLLGTLSEASLAVRKAELQLERFPAAWHGAAVRRARGFLLLREGRLQEGRQALDAALAAFTLAGDLPEAARTRHCLAQLETWGSPEGDGKAALEEARAACERLEVCTFELATLGLLDSSVAPLLTRPGAGEGELPVAIQRLSLRGLAASQIERETLAVVQRLCASHEVRLEELSPDVASTGEDWSWFELGDGFGRRLRLGVRGTLEPERASMLRTVCSVASLALEISTLRGFTEVKGVPEQSVAAEDALPGVVMASPSTRALVGELRRLSASRATVIIKGESGTGKEVVARAVHDVSVRKDRPFIAFNCAAAPRDLFEGLLFGYRKGAFTSATSDNPGVIRAADGGTLFLDEVGELPLDVQPKLLRFLENREILPLGEQRPLLVDVRMIAATHRDLEALTREGKFRADLFYRLQVVSLQLRPLRERPEDVVALARHFVRQFTPPGSTPPVLAPDALATLVAHTWPGNVRELRNVIERALAYSPLPQALGAAHLSLG